MSEKTDTKKPQKKNKTMDRNSLSYWTLISTAMMGAGVVVFVLLVIVFFAPEVFTVNLPEPPAVTERVDKISTKVSQLDQKIDHIEQTTQKIETKTLNNRLNSLENQLNTLSYSTEKMKNAVHGLNKIRQDFQNDGDIIHTVSQISELVTTLDHRVETIQSENQEIKSNIAQFDNQEELNAVSMLLVAAQFEGSVNQNMPFAEELEAIKSLFNMDEEAQQALTKLQPFSTQGVPDKQMLLNELNSISDDLIKAAIADDRTTVRNTLKNKLGKYVKIYQENGILPVDDVRAIINRARQNIENGDIDQAIVALSEIKGPAASIIEPFFDEAQARVIAERLSKKLSKKAVEFVKDAQIGSTGNMSPVKNLY